MLTACVVGAPEGSDTGNKIRNAAPAGRPVGPPRGGFLLPLILLTMFIFCSMINTNVERGV